jgi:hypothetical protein
MCVREVADGRAWLAVAASIVAVEVCAPAVAVVAGLRRAAAEVAAVVAAVVGDRISGSSTTSSLSVA